MELLDIVDALITDERSKFDVAETTRGGPGAGEKTEMSAVEPSSLEDSASITDVHDTMGRVFAEINDFIDFRDLIVFLSRLFLSSVAPRQFGSRGTGTSRASDRATSTTSTSGTKFGLPGTTF